MRIHKKSVLITNIGEWEQNAGPKLEHQWAPGRSALECATAWCEPDGPVVPSEFAALFAGHQFAGFEIESVQPEHCIRFDNLRGGPRNADLAIEATDRNGRIAITVEAKADEPFDGTLDEMMMAALEARLKNPRSGAVRRIEQLTESLFTPRVKGQPRLVQIRYQLMTAVAGTLAYAQEIKATRAICVIHQFRTPKTFDDLIERNQRDLNAFVHRLSRGSVTEISEGLIVGPISIPGEPLFPKHSEIFLAKISRDTSSVPKIVEPGVRVGRTTGHSFQ